MITAWPWLALAGLFEVAWVVLLKQSDGFSPFDRPGWNRQRVNRQA